MLSTVQKKPTNIMRKKVLQKHQVATFNKTLLAIETDLLRRIAFIENYGEVFKFPSAIARHNLREYKKHLKAIDKLKTYKQ